MAKRVQVNECFQNASQFDYDSLSPSVAKFLRGQAERIRHSYTTSIIRAGKALMEAKRHLSHGAFIRWVRSELGIPVRTTQAYMQVAQWVKDKGAAVTHLPPSVLYILSARSTPCGFTAALLNRHEAGEEIDARSIRAELMAIRAAQRKTSSLKTEIPLAELPRPQGEIVQPNMKAQVMLAKVVDILVSRLSPSEF